MGEVTREDAIRFCNAAMRNWQYVSFDEDELEDLRVELQRRLTTAQAEIEALRALAVEALDLAEGLHESHDYLGTGSCSRLADKEWAEDAGAIKRIRAALSGSQT